MKIHGICMVKDEVDIIDQTLKAAIQWCDFIYVFDNGSSDGTWEKILALSKNYEQIIPYKHDDCTFNSSLRGEVFNYYRDRSEPGDWWCTLDADEIYIDNPRIFLAKVPEQYQNVWNASFQYYFTDKDLERYNQDPSLFADDVPVEQKCSYYLNNWSEARFFKYDEKLVWDKNRGWPYVGAVYPVRIWLKHYQYRSPQQIQKRIETRRRARERGSSGFRHEAKLHEKSSLTKSSDFSGNQPHSHRLHGSEWKQRVVKTSQLNYDARDRRYILREDLMPKLPSLTPVFVNRLRGAKKYLNRVTLKKISITYLGKDFIGRYL